MLLLILLLCMQAYNLIEPKELAPLQELINQMLSS